MSKRSFLLLTSAALTLILLTSHSPVKSQGELPQANADTFDVHFFITSPNPNVLANDTPVNGNLQVQYMQPVYTSLGVATVGWNGAVGFTSYGGNGSVTIPYSITDGYTNSTSTITFNVHNTAPVAVTDHYTVRDYGYFSQPGEGPGDNDFDPDSDSFSITNQVQWASIPGAGGSYYNIVGGRISIIRSGTFVGTAVIGYEACDGLCSSGSILVNFLPLDGASDAGNSCPLVPVVARPVNPTSGNMWLKHDDYGLPGIGENIEISRVYNSVNQQSGIFGFGWTTKYDESLGFYGDKLARLNLPDGRAAYFDRGNTTESYKSVWNDIRGEITAEASEYRVKFLDGRIHGFSASGKLLWQKDRNGNQTTLAYDLNGLLITITDAFNRTLTINHLVGVMTRQIASTGTLTTRDRFIRGNLSIGVGTAALIPSQICRSWESIR
jgi:YD repeat-containing protein